MGNQRQTLAAMTWALDRAVGSITDKLEKEGLLDNTLIFFLSDNGSAHNNQSSSLPLKGWKGNKFEGGHRVSFFVTWASEISGGGKFDGLTSSLDIYATAHDAAGFTYHCNFLLDGASLVPYLAGTIKDDPHKELYWRKGKMSAARLNDYKLICVEHIPSVMFNLADDLGEVKDLSASDVDQFEKINSNLEAWEEGLISPLWTEGAKWDSVTWMIHQDLMSNNEVRAKDPSQFKKIRQALTSKKMRKGFS
jgi:arylsulfatase A-like enzyme